MTCGIFQFIENRYKVPNVLLFVIYIFNLHSHVVPAISNLSFPIMDRILDTISSFSSAFKYGPSPLDPPTQYPEKFIL